MAIRTETSEAQLWGRRVQSIQATEKLLNDELAMAADLDQYEELVASFGPIEARRRIVANQLIERLERRFPDNAIKVLESIYGQATSEQGSRVLGTQFDALWSEFHMQDPKQAAALMEERILPYYYGILQPDSSFPGEK